MQGWNNIWTLTLKEWRSLFGDGVLAVLLVVVFTVMVYQTANSGGTDLRHSTVAVVDLDQSTLSREIAHALPQPYFKAAENIRLEDVNPRMDKGDFVFVLTFPPNFERDVLMNRAPEVQLLVDATAMTQAGIGQGYIQQIFQQQINEFLGQKDLAAHILPTKPVVNVVFNPNAQSKWFLGVMEVNNMATMLGLLLVGAAVIRERERGTMEHLLVMPVNATQIVLSKILANILVVCLAATLSMKWVAGGLLNIDIQGSIWLYGFGLLIFLFSISSLAVMLATVAPTMPQYSLLMIPLYVVALMFSGAASPRSNMPAVAQWVSEYWPTTQFAAMSQNVIFRGATLDMVYPQILIMTGTGVLFLLLALGRFKKMLEKQG